MPTKVRFPRHVSADYVDTLNVDGGGNHQPDGIVLDLTEFRRTRLFGEARLLGFLAAKHRAGIPIEIRLGSRLPAHSPSNKYWKSFLDSVAGLILAQFADRIVDPEGTNWVEAIRDQQAQQLEENLGLIGSGKEVAAPIVDRFGRPRVADLLQESDVRRYNAQFRKLLLHQLGLGALPEDDVSSVCEFAYETFENTRDHALTDLVGIPIPGIRFVAVRRINLPQESLLELARSGLNAPADELDTTTGINEATGGFGESSPVSVYLELLDHELAMRYQQPRHLVEITIADSGVGIPARMAQTESVYSGDLATERQNLLRALERTGTSKPSSVAGAGLGLNKVMEATANLRGLIVFRTGRSYVYRHYLGPSSGWPSLELFDWASARHQYIAGTAISLIFPWMHFGQTQLTLG